MRGRTVLAGLSVSVLMAGCGSTVQTFSSPDQAPGVGAGLGTPGPLGEPAPVVPTAGPGASPSGSRGIAGSQPPTAASATPREGATAAPAGSGPVGVTQGITPTSITLGVVALRGGAAFANGFGLSISFGDAEREFQAVVADVNKRGGVAGRQLRTVLGYYDLGSAAVDPEGQQAALCSLFTEDNQVFAVLMPYNPLPAFVSCLAKRKTLLLNGSALSSDDTGLGTQGWHVLPASVSYSRYPETLARSLSASGFLPPGASAGIVHLDSPDHTRTARGTMTRALQGVRANVVAVAAVDPGKASADISAAVLKLRTAGATHVFFVQAAGGIPLYFMQDAEQQGWRPRYGVSSFEAPGFLLQGNAPAAQLANAAGIGWQPFFDVKASQFPTRPAERRCFDVIATGGERNADRQSNITATPVCDLVWSFVAAAGNAGRDLNSTTWGLGLRRLGTTYDSPVALRTDFSSGRPDGAEGYRYLRYEGGCSCFRYAGPLKGDLR